MPRPEYNYSWDSRWHTYDKVYSRCKLKNETINEVKDYYDWILNFQRDWYCSEINDDINNASDNYHKQIAKEYYVAIRV